MKNTLRTVDFKPFKMTCIITCAFISPSSIGSSVLSPSFATNSNTTQLHKPACFNRTKYKVVAQLSSPFPQPDVFAIPQLAFPSTSAPDVRPELLGGLLWTVALYFGFSQTTRWSDAVRRVLTSVFEASKLPHDLSAFIADVIHTIPFLFAGLAVDASLRVAGGGSTVWALATGTSAMLYAGIYELGRQSLSTSRVSADDATSYDSFIKFADRKLQPKGMCHLLDVRNAIKADSSVSARLRHLPDVTLHRFVRNRFPKARRSPNGFYRGLSIRRASEVSNVKANDSDAS